MRQLKSDSLLIFVFTDINECQKKNGGCQQTCINIAGSYKCACRYGFVINEDSKTCTGKLEVLKCFTRAIETIKEVLFNSLQFL